MQGVAIFVRAEVDMTAALLAGLIAALNPSLPAKDMAAHLEGAS